MKYVKWIGGVALCMALYYGGMWFDGGGLLYDAFGPSPMPTSLYARSHVELYDMEIVEIVVWPDSTRLRPGESVQFYSAMMLSTGYALCTDGEANDLPADSLVDRASPAPWVHEGCDSAVALLAPYEPQDTAFVRFIWDLMPGADSYDSLFYHVLLRSGIDTAQYIDDIAVLHPGNELDWKNGVAGTDYDVRVYAEGFFNYAGSDTSATGPPGPWTRFGYPQHFAVPLPIGPVRVDTVQGAMAPSDPEYFLAYSYSPDRSEPQPLEGAVLHGEVYIFLATTDEAGRTVVAGR